MAMIKRGSRGWQLLTVAVIALPWLLRDELATRLDAQSAAAAEVQTAMNHETEREAQVGEQRETHARLQRIEIMVAKVARETTAAGAQQAQAEVESSTAKHEAEELVRSADTFLGLVKTIPITPQPVEAKDIESRKALDTWLGFSPTAAGGLSQAQLLDLGTKVRDTAQGVANSANPAKGDWTEWNSATDALNQGYNALWASAQAAEKSSAAWADIARWAAWLFTALGALMIGDWSRTGRGRDADAAMADDTTLRSARDDRKAA
jgi:hypothetical protein